jgi:hypothetical protein
MPVKTKDLIEQAECFGLICIVRSTEITVMGTKYTLIFKQLENEECQLIQII